MCKRAYIYATAYGPTEYIYHAVDSGDRAITSGIDLDVVHAYLLANNYHVNMRCWA